MSRIGIRLATCQPDCEFASNARRSGAGESEAEQAANPVNHQLEDDCYHYE